MQEIFDRLPKRLTIGFPLWLIYGTKGENSPYYDIEKVIREHADRGFNCIRIDSGVGLIHDQSGRLRGPFDVGDNFGEYERIPRQQGVVGDGGKCDLLGRLTQTLEACKKYGVYVILSSWYYLHTYWFHKAGDPVCDELFAIPYGERFDAFRKFWHYLLLELESRGLDSQIAFVEIFNEANDHPYLCGDPDWGGCANISPEETAVYRQQHEAALGWLQKEHPNLLFAYDVSNTKRAEENMPKNAQVFNFHSYYLWSAYNETVAEHPEWFRNVITPEMVAEKRKGRLPAAQGWYDRVAKYNDLDMAYLGAFETALEEKFLEKQKKYRENREKKLRKALEYAQGRMPVVCGEGVSYIAAKDLQWEEKSESYWQFVKEGLALYKEAGLWGTVIRTCCGLEDPCWYAYAHKLLELNKFFLAD